MQQDGLKRSRSAISEVKLMEAPIVTAENLT